jgi:hypothetical protein
LCPEVPSWLRLTGARCAADVILSLQGVKGKHRDRICICCSLRGESDLFLSTIFIYYFMILLSIPNWTVIMFFIFALLLGGVLLLLFWSANYLYIKKTDTEISGKKYVAVVLTNDKSIYFSGVMFLIMYLKKNKIPYKLMKEFDIKKFQEFIYDTNCYGLYVLGHGVRHGLKISNNEILYYCNFKDAPIKEFVVQLHCNEYGGESLADIIALNKDKSYVPDGFQSCYANLVYFTNLYRRPPKNI